jgi:hypothetical protein
MQLGDGNLGDEGGEDKEPSSLRMLDCREISCTGGRRNAQSTSLCLWEQQVGDAVGIDKGDVVVVLDVVVKSCNAKKDVPVTQIKRYFEKN